MDGDTEQLYLEASAEYWNKFGVPMNITECLGANRELLYKYVIAAIERGSPITDEEEDRVFEPPEPGAIVD